MLMGNLEQSDHDNVQVYPVLLVVLSGSNKPKI